MSEKIRLSDAEWRERLTPQQYEICRRKGTEAPFSGEYAECDKDGIYRCICCGQVLFSSDAKYDAGCGWPSFREVMDPDAVGTAVDTSHGMRRVEVTCKACDAHLGHVFDDGPEPTGVRYCINSAALSLQEKK